MNDRGKWLSAADTELLTDCVIDHHKATGRGGQKRNKTSSAVRLTHRPSGVQVVAANHREQSRNTTMALRRLRIAIAMTIRDQFRGLSLPIDTSPRNPRYPVWLAEVLDCLEDNEFRVSEAAAALSTGSGRLVRLLCRDGALWTEVNHQRSVLGLRPLKNPTRR